jgi:Sulfotransferase family
VTRWPNLFVVGAARSATTMLWRNLGAHPEIFMSPFKEPHHFADEARPEPFPSFRDEAAYLELFAGAAGERYLGEASTNYLPSPAAPGRIRERSPDARIVISLRDPVTREHSIVLLGQRQGARRDDFAETIRAGLAPFSYAESVGRWLDAFGDRVHVLVFEELVADVRGALGDLFEWLDLDPSPAQTLQTGPVNRFGVARSRPAGALMRSQRARRAAGVLLPRSVREWLYDRAVPHAPPPPIDPNAVALLRERTRADTERLECLLDRELPWGR